MSQVFSLPGLTEKQVMLEILEAIPSSWLYPEKVQACIKVYERTYATPGYKASKNELRVPVSVEKHPIGEIIVGYPKLKTKAGKSLFLDEEEDQTIDRGIQMNSLEIP